MKIYKKNGLIHVDDGDITPFNPQISTISYPSSGYVKIIESAGNGVKQQNIGLWSTVQDENGDTFASLELLQTYISTLFYNAPLGGGAENYFYVKSTADLPAVQNLEADVWNDFVFDNIDVIAHGLFVREADVIRYTGKETILVFLNMSGTVFSGVPNTFITLAQYKNDIIDYGAIATVLLETISAKNSLTLTTTFVVSENDTLNLKIKASKDCNLEVEHLQSNTRMNNILI